MVYEKFVDSLDFENSSDIIIFTHLVAVGRPMPATKHRDPKSDALRERGAFNPHPERVTAELFPQSEFFDARDLPQVKYEMLRRVQKDGVAITRAAEAFGFSRPSFYQAQTAFAAA